MIIGVLREPIPVWMVRRAGELANAVGRIVVGQEGFGTGFLISPRFLLTVHSVIPDAATAAKSTVQFDYYPNEQGVFGAVTSVSFDPDAGFVTDKRLDFTLVALREPAKDRPSIPLPSHRDTFGGGKVTLLHHPNAGPLEIALHGGDVPVFTGEFFDHTVDTLPGSGGGPILDPWLRLLGVHHAASLTKKANQAIRIGAIAQFLKKHGVQVDDPAPFGRIATTETQPSPTAAPAEIVDTAAPQTRDAIFISYAHDEEGEWRERLRTYLAPLGSEMDVWDDTRIRTGAEWRTEIDLALKRARVAVLLVGPQFLASDFIARNELPPLLDAAAKEGVKILPLITNACLYTRTKLGRFQAFRGTEPLEAMSRPEQNARLVEFAEEIADVFSGN